MERLEARLNISNLGHEKDMRRNQFVLRFAGIFGQEQRSHEAGHFKPSQEQWFKICEGTTRWECLLRFPFHFYRKHCLTSEKRYSLVGDYATFFSSFVLIFLLSGADPLAVYRWSILRSFFKAVHAFKVAGREYRSSKKREKKTCIAPKYLSLIEIT